MDELRASTPIEDPSSARPSAEKFRVAANQYLNQGECSQAIQCYGASIEASEEEGLKDSHLAKLYSNRALAHIKNGSYTQAKDAQKARHLDPAWPKPLHRLAQALAGLSQWEDALEMCKEGAARSGGTSDFAPLIDVIAVTAAQHGSMAGFSGRKLEAILVRDAGEDAWLGREAPEDPDLDGPEDPLLALPSSSGSGGALMRKGLSFRSLHAAVAAARDGDQILLKKGIHNGLGETVHVSKRVLIRGEGSLGETRIDHRANCPTLRISRSCVIQDLDIDMTGFREALKVEGAASVQPVCQNCIIRCSGDDAVNICGKAAPVFRACSLRARKCGVRAYERAAPSLVDCKIEACGEQGVKTFEHAALFAGLPRCTLADCEEDGIVAMDQSSVRLEECTISSCKGPAVDVTNHAQLHATACRFKGCMGVIWAWDNAKADVTDSQLQSQETYVVLADSKVHVQLQASCCSRFSPFCTEVCALNSQGCKRVWIPICADSIVHWIV
ncbi:hypothetical protein COCSUDRAFT_16318 [Coccomyxa subellipsoidea C-169]|uniref:Right handed beta helix domain-containing protein n=1 Tax=Coccomyxa subellipsoidea (strain C-169) TaxID=574566 RepID=I0YWH5_COCSC|nr:hypothetical protein COCSUDRAFT_16318 [Coccomyxa subellipsoidea C-169]EIE22744.1 hypothetical protein COCSUDRAFT_16318 [Coccomyxa subellipsoidea C-169]|eukprot:XP_005647288.1 hypothetical protein COCSUDRAFT_16318 [Coccomyxa subellipsoidea C-169]